MKGMTDGEKALAIERGGHAAAFGLALAELSMFWDSHHGGAPDMHQPRMSIRVDATGDPEDKIAAVQHIADWLGVPVVQRYGVYIAQRRFGTGQDSILVECHYTPDFDRTHDLVREAAKQKKDAAASREAGRELAATGRAA